MRRRSKFEIVAVDLAADGAIVAKSKITELLMTAGALEDEGCARILAFGGAQIIAAGIVDHGRETDADELLRRKARMPPQRAGFAGAGKMHLARLRLPGACSGHAAAN